MPVEHESMEVAGDDSTEHRNNALTETSTANHSRTSDHSPYVVFCTVGSS